MTKIYTERLQHLPRLWVEGLKPGLPQLESVLEHGCTTLRDVFDLDLVFAASKHSDGTMRVMSHACSDDGALKEILEIGLRWDGPGANPCIAKVLDTGRLHLCGPGEAHLRCWLGAQAGPPGHTLCVLPIISSVGAFGVIVMRSRDARLFDDQVLRILRDEFQVQLGLILERSEQETRLALLGGAVAAAANAIFITDRDAVIEWVNDAFVELTGFSREAAIGQTPLMLRSGKEDAEYYNALRTAIRTGKPWSGEITNKRRDGTLYVAQQTITPILEGGRRVQHFVAIQQDITERKRMEREIAELALNIELARQFERDQIAREVHDDLGGSLASLRHDIEWMIERSREPAAVERLNIMLELVAHSLASAQQIIAGLRSSVVEELGLVDALGWLAREFKQHHEIDIALDLAPALKEVGTMQAAEIYRVVQECLTNVAKHAHAGAIRISGRLDDQLLVFEVEDDGIGTRPGSAALGSRGMAERARLMGGHLEVEPAGPNGTRVRLVVPLAHPSGET